MENATRRLIRSAVHGAAAVVDSPTGCSPARLPDWALAQVDDPILRLFGDTTSGVRLSFVTSASWIELTALTDRTMIPGTDPGPCTRPRSSRRSARTSSARAPIAAA